MLATECVCCCCSIAKQNFCYVYEANYLATTIAATSTATTIIKTAAASSSNNNNNKKPPPRTTTREKSVYGKAENALHRQSKNDIEWNDLERVGDTFGATGDLIHCCDVFFLFCLSLQFVPMYFVTVDMVAFVVAADLRFDICTYKALFMHIPLCWRNNNMRFTMKRFIAHDTHNISMAQSKVSIISFTIYYTHDQRWTSPAERTK